MSKAAFHLSYVPTYTLWLLGNRTRVAALEQRVSQESDATQTFVRALALSDTLSTSTHDIPGTLPMMPKFSVSSDRDWIGSDVLDSGQTKYELYACVNCLILILFSRDRLGLLSGTLRGKIEEFGQRISLQRRQSSSVFMHLLYTARTCVPRHGRLFHW